MPKTTWHIPSSFKIGRHSQWRLSMLHLMHSLAQFRRQSLSISTYSCLLQSIQLQWVRSLVRVLTRHYYCGNHSHHDWHLDGFNGLTMLIIALGVTVGVCSCVMRITQISCTTRLVLEVLCGFQHQLYIECESLLLFFPTKANLWYKG